MEKNRFIQVSSEKELEKELSNNPENMSHVLTHKDMIGDFKKAFDFLGEDNFKNEYTPSKDKDEMTSLMFTVAQSPLYIILKATVEELIHEEMSSIEFEEFMNENMNTPRFRMILACYRILDKASEDVNGKK